MRDDELQSVKNRYLAGAYRQLTSNFSVMIRYGVARRARANWRDGGPDATMRCRR